MQVFYFKEEEGLPEGAQPFNLENVLKMDADASVDGPFVFVNPQGEKISANLKTNHHWIELYTEHKFCQVHVESWLGANITPLAGIISGFGLETGLKLAQNSVLSLRNVAKRNEGASILYVNGPNLNLLGTREPDLYGKSTLKTIFDILTKKNPNLNIRTFQENIEGNIINGIHAAREDFDALIINAGAYTHTSIAIHDALKVYDDIIIELHVTNPHQREAFRHPSYIAPASHGLIAGFGAKGYPLALLGALSKL